MKAADSLSAALLQPAAGTRRIEPQVDRYHWEQQWLAANRDADAGGHADTGARAPADRKHSDNGTVAQTEIATENTGPGGARPAPAGAVPAAASGAGSAAAAFYRAAIAGAAEPMPWAAPAPARPVFYSAAELTVPPPLPAQRRRPERRRFALWRAGDTVALAVRLQDPEHDAPSLLRTLRHWLRTAHCRLVRLVVNGRELWRDDDSKTT